VNRYATAVVDSRAPGDSRRLHRRPLVNVRVVSSRRFNWISSARGDPALLADLEERMQRFYGRRELRDAYQKFVDEREALDHPFERAIAEYLKGFSPLLEVGCGSARLYRTLRRAGFSGRYTGIEVADYLIEDCRRRHPEATFAEAGAYAIPGGPYEACFSYGVIESLVYPQKALSEMARVSRRLVLLFPDFIESGHLGSQLTGLRPGRRKLRQGRVLDALLTLYDQKLRLPRALRAARARLGPFPVNLSPIALDHPEITLPDYDAVYIASKADLEEWAAQRGFRVEYPLGRTLPRELRARSWAFAVIQI
jgi:SAM-dependent methyltransferase